jgi:hypothetical protein
MAGSVTVTPASVTLSTVGAAADVTITVAGEAPAVAGISDVATFPVTIGGVVVNGTLSLAFPGTPQEIPVHGTPTLGALIAARVTLTRTSLSADGLTAIYHVVRTS